MRRARHLLAVALVLAAVLAGGATAAGATEPIRPNQHFVGLVNGRNVKPVVYTVCAGPIWPGRTGPVAGGQHLAVGHVASGAGYTGLFSQVYAWFAQDSSASRPRQVRFTSYGTQRAIPPGVRVPCDGTGTVEFSSCPYLAPCAFGWIPDHVQVTFVNLAV